jgi:hypothetical protein
MADAIPFLKHKSLRPLVDASLRHPGPWQDSVSLLLGVASVPEVFECFEGIELAWREPRLVVRVYPALGIVQWFVLGAGTGGGAESLGTALELLQGAGLVEGATAVLDDSAVLEGSGSLGGLTLQWLSAIERNVSASTRSTYAYYVRRFVAWCGEAGVQPADLKDTHVDRWLARTKMAEASRSTARSPVRRFVRAVVAARARASASEGA